jgi:hypothetical protein
MRSDFPGDADAMPTELKLAQSSVYRTNHRSSQMAAMVWHAASISALRRDPARRGAPADLTAATVETQHVAASKSQPHCRRSLQK